MALEAPLTREVTMCAYLLQGFFFQWQMGLGIGHDAEFAEVAVIEQSLGQFMYSGAIWSTPEDPSLVGKVGDFFGEADLSEISITDGEFKFTKHYRGRTRHARAAIHYTFRKEGQEWIGEFSGRGTGKGVTRCILIPVPDNFFDPRAAASLLGKPEYLETPSYESK